jgi:hypothetical protein
MALRIQPERYMPFALKLVENIWNKKFTGKYVDKIIKIYNNKHYGLTFSFT